MRAASLLLATLVVCLSLAASRQAVAAVSNGGFEDGLDGWVALSDSTLEVHGDEPVSEGAAAAHVTSEAAGTVGLRSQYWQTDVEPAHTYTLTVAVRAADDGIAGVTARLDLVDADEGVLVTAEDSLGGADDDYRTLSAGPLTAPDEAAHMRVTVVGDAVAAGAAFSVDAVSFDTGEPEPTPTPPPDPGLPEPDDDDDDGPSIRRPTPTPTPTPTPAPTPTATATPTATPTVTPPRVAWRAIGNGGFEGGLDGWSVAGGRATLEEASRGPALVLHAPGSRSVWVEQPVGGVVAGGWYEASALLAARSGVDAAWLRVAWYASPVGAGAQMSTVDSAIVRSPAANAFAEEVFEAVGTGPVQAPPAAMSANVRILLAPQETAGAAVVVDEVTFGEVETPRTLRAPTAEPSSGSDAAAEAPPPAATETPSAATSAADADEAPPAGADGTPEPTPEAVPEVEPEAETVAQADVTGLAGAQHAIRVTELLPDPQQPGRDGDREWVELTNLDAAPVSIEGMRLSDNARAVTLPALVLPAGGSLVLAGSRAETGQATVLRVADGIGNGLGNTGDRLVLEAAGGAVVDAFSYGDDSTHLAQPRIPAPAPGQTLERRFSGDGSFAEAVPREEPTPGSHGADLVVASAEVMATATATPTPEAQRPATASPPVNVIGWMALVGLGAGLLGGGLAVRLAGRGGGHRGDRG